jgi:hypothetical protein
VVAGGRRGATGPVIAADYSDGHNDGHNAAARLADRLALSPLERQEFDFTDLDNWMRQAEQAIRRAQAVLDQGAAPPRATAARADPS